MSASDRRNFLSSTLTGGAAFGAGIASLGLHTEKAYAMKTITEAELGRVIILSFELGELLLEGTREKLKELDVKNAVLVSGIGTFSKARFHRITNGKTEYPTVEGPMELSSVSGIVANGQPHFHMTFADLEKTYAGHLEDGCVVWYLAELVLIELIGVNLVRKPLLDQQ